DLLLEVLEGGSLRDGQGRAVDCSHALFLLTSNHVVEESAKKKVGFAGAREEEATTEELEQRHRKALEGAFRPEFIGRLDGILPMRPLAGEAAEQVARSILKDAIDRLEALGLAVTVEGEPAAALAKLANASFGARPMRAAVEQQIVQRAS